MDASYTFEPYNTVVDTIDQAQIDQVLREIEWETHFNATGAKFAPSNTHHPHYTLLPGYGKFEEQVSTKSELGSPGSMTTASTNPSPILPLLEHDLLSFDTTSIMEGASFTFPELMTYHSNILNGWPAESLDNILGFELSAGSGQSIKKAASGPSGGAFCSASCSTLLEEHQQTSSWNSLAMVDYPRHMESNSAPVASNHATSSSASGPSSSTSQQRPLLTCPHCSAELTDRTKLRIHTNKHTKPFRCSVAGCDHSTAEKKSLHRHMLVKARSDKEHLAAAQERGLKVVYHGCTEEDCSYTTIREDNLNRHKKSCHPTT